MSIIFEQWRVTTISGVSGSIVAVLALAVLYECTIGLHVYLRSRLKNQKERRRDDVKMKNRIHSEYTSYSSCCWISLTNGGGNWFLSTTANLTVRPDIGKINSSPISALSPIVRHQQGCPKTITIPAEDPDGDKVRCRWSNDSQRECGGVCHSFKSGALDEEKCTLSLYSNAALGWHAVAITLEDFPASTTNFQSATPFSQVGLQFLVYVSPSSGPCNRAPVLIGQSPNDGSCEEVSNGNTFSCTIEAKHIDSSRRISEINTVTPLYMVISSLLNYTDQMGDTVYYNNVSWNPRLSQKGRHIFCFKAMDNYGIETEERCITLLVGSNNTPSPLLYSRTPVVPQLIWSWPEWFGFVNFNITFDQQIKRPRHSKFVRIVVEGHVIYKLDTRSSSDVTFDQFTLTFRLPQRVLSMQGNYSITIDRGVVVGVGCTSDGPPSPGISSFKSWRFEIGVCSKGTYLNTLSCKGITSAVTAILPTPVSLRATPAIYSPSILQTSPHTSAKPGITVKCTGEAMFIFLERKSFQGFDPNKLALLYSSCRASYNDSHISLRTSLNDCGTTHNESEDAITFYNEVRSVQSYCGNIITREQNVSILFYCSYRRKALLRNPSFKIWKTHFTASEGGYGNFTFTMDLFKTGRYLTPYSYNDYPITVHLRDRLFLQLAVRSYQSNLVLFVDTCKATTTTDPYSVPQYIFLQRGCKLDSTLNYSYSISSKQRFSIQAFRFIEDHPVVHLHCEVLACHRNTARSRCLQGCSRYRGRRSDREAYGSESTKAYDMSSGPINFKKESSGTETKEAETQSNMGIITIMAASGGFCLLLVIILIIVVIRMKKQNKVYAMEQYGKNFKQENNNFGFTQDNDLNEMGHKPIIMKPVHRNLIS
ncbi:CUB and zona pellucida-like domain-containing protein 1 [Stylophora pistillata]|uniref:CUB and zona pellucida-like domain-containing protein 1 n=1 Tax=Stylophora pistillata TaxID=50429 RepID=A0A2B4SEL7_STYPI|nr:CUB and zona pellucida-like domain-containing protein 1 [Stylophora pistillata]